MVDAPFIDWNTEEILREIAAKYKLESGEELEIGSEAMAIASAVTYIIGVAKNRFNEMAKQRFLDTATGHYLDMHAMNLINKERPQNIPAKIEIDFDIVGDTPIIHAGTEIISEESGIRFQSVHTAAVDDTLTFVCVEEDVELGNGILAGHTFNLVDPIEGVEAVRAVSSSYGGVKTPYPYTDAGDQAFREYIKHIRDGVSVAGPYAAYKKLIKEADPRVLDVYILQSGDWGFTPGHIMARITHLPELDSMQSVILENVYNALLLSDDRPMNDHIDYPLPADWENIGDLEIHIKYDPKMHSGSSAQSIAEDVCEAYKKELLVTFEKNYSISELACRLMKIPGIVSVGASNLQEHYIKASHRYSVLSISFLINAEAA